MTNTEICEYVNSKDIRQHLMEIGYEFSSIEAAWLVYQCESKTLEGKWEVWEDIIRSMYVGLIND
ncbi:MAG: hypothetical protein J5819_09200 [Eubacterium sp.]|nr:hypothetical protein [Eubacterium sp.]